MSVSQLAEGKTKCFSLKYQCALFRGCNTRALRNWCLKTMSFLNIISNLKKGLLQPSYGWSEQASVSPGRRHCWKRRNFQWTKQDKNNERNKEKHSLERLEMNRIEIILHLPVSIM